MMASDEESTTCTERTEKRKKKKQKLDKSEKGIVEESPHHHNENTKKKKKRKRKASVSEDASDMKDVIPKKTKNLDKVLDEDKASCDPETDGDVPEENTTLAKDLSSGDPTSTKGTRKKKKKKKAIDNETSICDPPSTEDAPEIITEKKTKKITKDDPLQTTNKSVVKSKAVTEEKSRILEDSENIVAKKKRRKRKKKGTKEVLSPSSFLEDKDITADEATNELDSSNKDSMASPKLKKCKKSKQPKNSSEDKAPDSGNVLTDGTVIQKNKKASELEVSRSPIEDQSKTSDCAKVKKKRRRRKKKKPASVETEDKVIEDHDETTVESLSVSKKKKPGKCSDIEESGQKLCDLNGNNYITEVASKKKKGNKVKEASDLVGATNESLHVICKEEKKKAKKKRKREERLKQTGEEHSANTDTSEVPTKKKKSIEENKNSKEAGKKQGKNSDVQFVSAQDGRTDEVHADTVKGKALEKDITRESGNSKGTKFGQWDTATFQNSDQQSKFFRLLGGFKKGNQANLTPPSNQVKANMALGKKEEHVLERNLQAEFDKAVDWKKNRGIGLGFQPAQKKTFYIDKTASKSIRFED